MIKITQKLIEITTRIFMSNFCKIYYAGTRKAPYPEIWKTSVQHDINRLIYVNDGEGGYIKDNVKIPFKKNCLYLITGFSHFIPTYSSYENENKRLNHSYANFEIIPPILSDEVICLDSFDDPKIKIAIEAFKTLCNHCTLNEDYEFIDDASKNFLKAIVEFLVVRICEKFNCEIVKDKQILNALHLMHKHINKKQLISDIAKSCFLSTNNFIKKFKKELGETPYSYLKKLKIRTAMHMRLQGISLSEIAEKCGYSEPSALLHAIKEK